MKATIKTYYILILHCGSFTVWIFYGASMLALIVLRYREPKLPRPYKVSHHMLIAHVNLFPVSSHLLM